MRRDSSRNNGSIGIGSEWDVSNLAEMFLSINLHLKMGRADEDYIGNE